MCGFFFAKKLTSLRFRRLWQNVTESLREKDIEKATEHKRLLEERQRTEERHRAETETAWRTRHFDKEVSSLCKLTGMLRNLISACLLLFSSFLLQGTAQPIILLHVTLLSVSSSH